jgi:hypothetical protein
MMPAIFTIPEIGGEYLPDRRCSLDIVEVFLPQAAPASLPPRDRAKRVERAPVSKTGKDHLSYAAT